MHHTMDGLDMLDPSGTMTTLTPMSDAPITSSHHQLHGSYHSMNHMMGHHHGGPLGGHTPGQYSFSSVFRQFTFRLAQVNDIR
jgi:POU domain transcription factor, class 4